MIILNTIEPDSWFGVVIFLIASFMIIFATSSILCDSILGGLCIGAVFTVVIAGVVIPVEMKNRSVRYEVFFENDTKVNDILDKYDIIDQEGKIYTIKEKTK